MSQQQKTAQEGVVAALAAYLIWGMLPVYFKIVAHVDPLEMLAHRVIWAIPFGAMILLARRQFPDVARAFSNRSNMAWLSVSTLFIGLNWFVYIWAIQDERIFETSLGYYINPLTNMLAGVLFFGERLRRLQTVAVGLAAIGVLVLAISGGVFPWVAMALAITFTIYATVRKRVEIGGMPGLFIETCLLLPFALLWMGYLAKQGTMQFANANTSDQLWLIMAGPVTALPLLMFALAARRLRLSTLGFMQFLAPTMQFGTGIYFGEVLTTAHIVCFAFVWLAVAFFIYDAIAVGRSARHVAVHREEAIPSRADATAEERDNL